MPRGQGSLEYLLIVAAILTLAVIVVLIANMMLGTPRETNIVTKDKYDFAVRGWEIRGYDRPFDPNTPSTRPLAIVNDETVYNDGGPTPIGAALIGTITGSDGMSYPVYIVGDNYHIGLPPSPACPASIPLVAAGSPLTGRDNIVALTASGLDCYMPASARFEIKISHTGAQTGTAGDYLLVRANHMDGTMSSTIYDYCAAIPSSLCVSGELPKVEPGAPVNTIYALNGINTAKKVDYFAYGWVNAPHASGTFVFNGGNVLV